MRTTLLCAALLVIVALSGCGDIAARVEKAENPAPAGTYTVETPTRVSLNERANYAWDIEGQRYDAVTTDATLYSVEGERVGYAEFSDAQSNEGVYEGYNESMDDVYTIAIATDGVIQEVDIRIGE